MKLALNSATLIKLPTRLSDLSSASVLCSFAMTDEDFLLWRQSNLHAISLTVTFQTENLNLLVLSLFQIGMQEVYMLGHTQNLQLPCKTNGTLGQVNSLLDPLNSLIVPKSTKSEDPFFFSNCLCVQNAGNAYPGHSSPPKMCFGYMCLYIVQ